MVRPLWVLINEIFTCTQTLTYSQLNLPTEPINKKSNGTRTKNKNRDAQKKESSHKVRGVSSKARRECVVEKGRCRFVKEVGLNWKYDSPVPTRHQNN